MTKHMPSRDIISAREYGRKDGGGNAGGGEEVAKLLDGLKTQLKQNGEQVSEFAKSMNEKLDKHGQFNEATKKTLDELLTDGNALKARVEEMEQKLARRPAGDAQSGAKSAGYQVIEHDEFKEFAKRKSGVCRLDVKSISSLTASAGTLLEPQRQPGIVQEPNRRFTIRQLCMPGRTAAASIEFVRENVFTNAAAMVSEGGDKPESNITYALETENVRKIAHHINATKEILDDAPQLQSQIDGRLRYGLDLVEENQLLLGDGTGQNLNGLIPNATDFDPAFTPASPTKIDTLRLAMLQVRLAEYEASGVVMHPTDWAEIELTKDAENRYIMANPLGLAGKVLWGAPVVDTVAITAGRFLTGAFNMAAQIFDREDALVEISTEHASNFTKNMVTILAEKRLTLVIYRPKALVEGALTLASN